MFEGRLKALLVLFGLVAVGWVLRLVHLQAVLGGRYHDEAQRLLIRRPQYIPCARGSLLDRSGVELAADEPCWEICVDYGLLSDDPRYLRRLARRMGLDPDNPAERGELSERIGTMWKTVAGLSGLGEAELARRADAIQRRVGTIRDQVTARKGYEVRILDETLAHPIVSELDDQQAVAARLALSGLPGAEVRASTRRRVLEDESLAHLLGRVGRVFAEDLERDPLADDPLARWLPSDTNGRSGAELLVDQRLRGRRGQLIEDRDGHVVQRVEPQRGEDVALSIDAALQRRVYQVMADAVAALQHSTGASAVMLDIPTRQVLALVSYPGYRPSDFEQRYDELLDDSQMTPLRFRAVANTYPPGSVCKPPTLIGALSEGLCDLATTVTCVGYLLPEVRDRWRCWRPAGGTEPHRHGPMLPEEAIKHSCNVFFYTLGERLGAGRLCEWLARFGLGRPPGTGLIEEDAGVLPTPAWLARYRGRSVNPGDGRNFALGQGELMASPLQVANMTATLASGVYRSPTLLLGEPWPREEEVLPVRAEHWEVVRRGMYRVVNEPGGTAQRYVDFRSAQFDLYGKSGSAQTQPVALAFRIAYIRDETEHASVVRARYANEARRRFLQGHPEVSVDAILSCEPTEWWPWPADDAAPTPSHAWFVGFVKPKASPPGKPDARVAIAVLIEYGGSGGQEAGPVVGHLASLLADEFPAYLTGEAARRHPDDKLAARP